MQRISETEVFARIGCAMLCGALVGWERERREKAAGLRTHVFVSMGSALVMIVSTFGFVDAVDKGLIVLDPSRIAAQVVSGIGFLGAGVIWFNRNKVRGLDTAAGIWATSAVGLAAGSGMYVPAFAVTSAVVLMNLGIKRIEQRFFPRRKDGRLVISMASASTLETVRAVIEGSGLKVTSVQVAEESNSERVTLEVSGPKTFDWLMLVGQMKEQTGVTAVSFNEPVTID
jgi:putative Mg2+ transporter-C (MgtC) family protein